MRDTAQAARVIEQFERFSPVAYWDVNHYRLGYGSDTRTREQIPVRRGDRTTRVDAFENLEVRLVKYEYVIIGQVGKASWDRLPADAQAGLMSMCYNYGHLPLGVAEAVRHEAALPVVANAVRAHMRDNRGVNLHRRAHEAQMIEDAK